jgi:hypothetical protein
VSSAALREKPPPAKCDFIVRPEQRNIGTRANNQMHVIGHEHVTERLNGKNTSQFFEATADPFAAMRVIAA